MVEWDRLINNQWGLLKGEMVYTIELIVLFIVGLLLYEWPEGR